MAARSSDLPGVVTARLVEELMGGYLDAFADSGSKPKESESATVRFMVGQALKRKWRHLHSERLGKKPRFPLGDRFLPLDAEERESVDRFLDRENVRRLVTRLECRDDSAKIKVIDAAYWVKGCSSLGLWRCAALIEVVGQSRSRGGYSLLDLKEAIPPLAPLAEHHTLPDHQGERVVNGTRALAPSLGQRMLSGTVAGHSVFVRELMPQDLKLELAMLNDAEARATARALAQIVGTAHARQLDDATRKSWRDELSQGSMRSMDAPGWLWSSVVNLVGVHERAYLDHCRRYALEQEKRREQREEAAE
jgi:uncharacterized protein (DUF2252 family)